MIKKILIIDDSPIARKILKKCFPEGQEFELFEAGNGLVGFEQYKEVKPNLTFLDLTMPVMDGFQTLEEIRAFDDNALVIVVSADIQAKTLFKVLDLGAFMMIKKPMSKEKMQDGLDKALEAILENV